MVARQSSLLLVRLPSEIDHPTTLFEEFLKSLHGQFPDATVSLELAYIKKHLYFFIECDRALDESITATIYAHYPYAEVEEVQDYLALDILERGMAFCEMRLTKSDILPIKTYRDFEGDSLSGICSAFSQLNDQEMAWMHVVISPRLDKWHLNLERNMKVKMNTIGSYINVANYFRVQSLKEIRAQQKQSSIRKASQPVFDVTIRLGTSSTSHKRAQERLDQLKRAFSYFNTIHLNAFKSSRQLLSQAQLEGLLKRKEDIKPLCLALDEITSLYHLPRPDDIPHVVHVITKKAQPPEDLPRGTGGVTEDISFFGVTNFHNEYVKFGIPRVDRRRHTYLLGKSGTGKSKLMELLITEDIKAGHGVGLIDPHGDLVDAILRSVPPERMHDVVVFNPADVAYPVGFNMLEHTPPERRISVASGFIDILKKIFKEQWNSRLEHITRFSLLASLEQKDSTIVTVLRLLTDDAYRATVVEGLEDKLVKLFWENEFPEIREKFHQEAIMPLVNKLGQFIASPLIRNIVTQTENKLNLADCINQGKIVLIRIAKGNLGEENVALLGSMIITKLYQAALERTQIPEAERRDFYLYCDEFQYFATDAFAEILSEARKFKLSLTMAHQYLGQLSPIMRSTVIGNVGTLIAFRVGSDDSHILENEFTPVFKARDVMNLGVREFYIKTSLYGELRNAFSGRTLNVPEPTHYLQDAIIEYSRKMYSTPRSEVEHSVLNEVSRNHKAITDESQSVVSGSEQTSILAA